MKGNERYVEFGVKLEDRYLIYEEENRRVAVPYSHMAFLYVSKNNLVIQTDAGQGAGR
jgi:hypothetical protein